MADAKVHRGRDIERAGKKPKHTDRDMLIKVGKIADDEKVQALIGKSRTVTKALPFGRFKISDTTTVTISCNQNAKTMVLADEIARKFVRKFLKQDMAESAKILEAAAEAIAEEEG